MDVKTDLLRYWLWKFRKVFKPSYRIYGKRTVLKDCYACVSQTKDGGFLLEVDKTLSQEALEAFLLHELGHVVAWDSNHPFTKTHGPEFGVAYALVWSKLKEE